MITSKPYVTNILTYAGDSLVFDVKVDGDYSAWTWTGQVRQTPSSEVDATFLFSGVTPDTDGWITTVSLPATATADLGGYSGVYDIQLTNNGQVITLLTGKIFVAEDVTRADS